MLLIQALAHLAVCRHRYMVKDGLGEVYWCASRWRRGHPVSRAFFRESGEHNWQEFPVSQYREIFSAATPLEAMAAARRPA